MAGDYFLLETNAAQVGDECRALADMLPELLLQYNAFILAGMRDEIDALYGPRIGALWNFEDTPETGALAHIGVSTSDPRAIGAEFGTRPHEIWASHTALKFEWNGELTYRKMVHHPGTKGKNLSPEIASTLERLCTEYWGQGLAQALSLLSKS